MEYILAPFAILFFGVIVFINIASATRNTVDMCRKDTNKKEAAGVLGLNIYVLFIFVPGLLAALSVFTG